jgi:hypothetical protein
MKAEPMDPERLADVRRRIACGRVPERWYADLLADRDYHAQRADDAESEANDQRAETTRCLMRALGAEAEVARLRARVRAESKDIPEILPSQIVGYLIAAGWRDAHVVSRDGAPLWTVMLKGDRGLDVPMLPGAVDYRRIVAGIVNEMAAKDGRAPLDILDEMAAMEVGP